MIDIINNIAKQRSRIEMERSMSQLIVNFTKALKPVINRQYIESAKMIDQFDPHVDFATNQQIKRMEEVFRIHYKKTATVFSNRAFDSIDEHNAKSVKATAEEDISFEFWAIMGRWMISQISIQVSKISWTTKDMIALIIKKGFEEGLSNNEIAKKVRKVGNITSLWRARRIARTEIHTIAEKTTNEVMRSSKIMQDKEWISALDERTRRGLFNHVRANGERVPMDGFFQMTGESLRYPGDSIGSAGNIANCRCGTMYHTKRIA